MAEEEKTRARRMSSKRAHIWSHFVKVKGSKGDRKQMMRGRTDDDTGSVGRSVENSFVLPMSRSTANNMLPKPINLELPGTKQ